MAFEKVTVGTSAGLTDKFVETGGGGGALTSLPILENAILIGNAQKLNFTGFVNVTVDGGDPNQINVDIQGVATEFDLPFSATPTFNVANGALQTMTLTGNVTNWTVPNGTAGGQTLTLFITQDGTGQRTWPFTWPANVTLLNDSFQPSPAAGVTSSLSLRWDSLASSWVETAREQLPLNDLRPHVVLAGSANSAIPYSGPQTLDGVLTGDNELVLVTINNLDPTLAGFYIASTVAAWRRPTWFALGSHAAGSMAFATSGVNNAQQIWKCDQQPGADIVGTSNLSFSQLVIGGVALSPNVIFYGDGISSGWISNAGGGTVRGTGTDYVIFTASGGNEAVFSFTTNTWLGYANTKPWQGVEARQYASVQTDVAFSATPTFDSTLGVYFTITLTGNITSWTVPNVPANTQFGGVVPQCTAIEIAFIQDVGGGHSLSAPPGNVHLTGGALAITGTGGAVTKLGLRYDHTLGAWYECYRALNIT